MIESARKIRPRQVPGTRFGLVAAFEKKGVRSEHLYCCCRTEAEALRLMQEVQARLPRGKPITFGWLRLILEEDWLFRYMPRRSQLVGFQVREINGV